MHNSFVIFSKSALGDPAVDAGNSTRYLFGPLSDHDETLRGHACSSIAFGCLVVRAIEYERKYPGQAAIGENDDIQAGNLS